MTVSLYYEFMGEKKSGIMSVSIQKDYVIRWHHMDQESGDMDTFYQSRLLTTTEFDAIIEELTFMFSEKQIPVWILPRFEEYIEHAQDYSCVCSEHTQEYTLKTSII
jgi:hypothetical protein